jgi:hypothetical protein
MYNSFARSLKSCAQRRWPTASVVVLLAVGMCMFATPSPAIDLIPISTSGFDQDVIFEAGLAAGQIGANGEFGSRQFFEAGLFPDGLPRSIVDFTSTITGNIIDFDFAPFEGNNILKFDTTTPGPKALTLATPGKYGQLAVVHSAGSLAITAGLPTEIALVTYTINYAGGATQTGTLSSVDWGNIAPENMPSGTEILINVDRNTANVTAWPVTSDNNTQANRWSLYISEITVDQPAVNIESVSFGPMSLNTPGTPLNGGDDVAIFGLAGSGQAAVLGDTNGNGIGGEYPDDFEPIQMNFRKAVVQRGEGDLVRNGIVDFDDFHQWKTAFLGQGGSLAGLDLNLGSSVPEPATGALNVTALLGLAAGARRRSAAGSMEGA